MTPPTLPLWIDIGSLSDNLVDLLLVFVEAALAIIGGALWKILGWFLTGYGRLILRTPYPRESGNTEQPAMWVTDARSIKEGIWRSGYEMYSGEMLPIALLLIGVALILSHFGHLLKQFPMMDNLNPSMSRAFFILILIMAWWTVMVGILSFSDALSVAIAGGTNIQETMGDPMSDPTNESASGGGGGGSGGEHDSWFIREVDENTPDNDGNSKAGWAGLITIILLLTVQTATLLLLIIFWTLRYMLVIMLGVGMPIFLALRAFEGTGIPVLGDVGSQAWDLWWFCVFMPLPAALVLRLGSFMSQVGSSMGGGIGGTIFGAIVSSLATVGVPMLAGLVPAIFYRRAMSNKLPGRKTRVSKMVRNTERRGQKAAGMASAYARSDERSRRGRLAEAIDEKGGDTANRLARRLSYGQDVADGVRGEDPATHDRYGRTTDAGGRSIFHNASNIAAHEATEKGNQIIEAAEKGVERATGREIDSGRLGGPERDINVEHIAGSEFDEVDVMREDLEEQSRSEIRRKLRSEREKQEVDERFQRLARGADESAMEFEERYKQVMEGDGDDIRHLMQMTDDKVVREEILDREQQRIYDDLMHTGDTDLVDVEQFGITEDDTRDDAAAKFLDNVVDNEDLQNAMVKDLQMQGFSDDESIENALDNVLGMWEDKRVGYNTPSGVDEMEEDVTVPATTDQVNTNTSVNVEVHEGETMVTPGEDTTQQRIRNPSSKWSVEAKSDAEAESGTDTSKSGVNDTIGRRQLEGETETVHTSESGVDVIGDTETHEVDESRVTKSVDYTEKDEYEGGSSDSDTAEAESATLPTTYEDDLPASEEDDEGGSGTSWR